MKQIHFPQIRSQIAIRMLAVLLLAASLLTTPSLQALAHEADTSLTDSTTLTEEELGQQAFLDFFGPDGVNECPEPENDRNYAFSDNSLMTVSDQQAVLTTTWETVGGGRINRKYLNGLVAFCYDEELAFPNGAIYQYAPASDASVSGQVAAIAQRFGRSGIDNAQWWSECQVAIWAVRAGCRSYDSAAAFARSYCADRKITDPATVEDYAYIVGTLVTETANASDTAYLYHADDPSNQRILTYLAVWPDPAPTYPSPKYDTVSATESYDASRQHSISLDHKTAAVTGESLSGAIFTVYEDNQAVGTITTDSQGQGSCQWQLTESASVTITKEYCSNYDKLDPETRKTITGYTNRDDAYTAARQEAQAEAQRQAETLASQSHTVTIEETTVPTGFSATADSSQTVTLTGTDTATISAINTPWSATLLIYKADGITGELISSDTLFSLYEWNGSDYEISPHYEIVRREDGIYTVDPLYEDGEPGCLYYTQKNQGKFALAETQAPHGYYLDPEIWYFAIQADDEIIYGHNVSPENHVINDPTKFSNHPKPQPQYDSVTATGEATATRTHQLALDRKLAAVTGESLAGAVFQVYEDGQTVGTITTDAQGQGSCQWQLTEFASATVTKEYCSNYEQLEPEEQALVSGFTSRDEALAAAQAEADRQAQTLADTLADQPRVVTIEETTVPTGFSATADSSQTVTFTGAGTGNDSDTGPDANADTRADNDSHIVSAAISAVNTPWSATLLIYKADGISGELISADTIFALYEWNGSGYEISPHYEIVRREDGIYTVDPIYEDGESGCLYYTQKNQGKFALAEAQAPHGYMLDEDWFYFEITEDGQTIWAHNAHTDHYPVSDDTKFFNQRQQIHISLTKKSLSLEDAFADMLSNPLLETSADLLAQISSLQATMSKETLTSQIPLSGAVFGLYAAEDTYRYVWDDATGSLALSAEPLILADTLLETVTTDENGRAVFQVDLPCSKYYVRELTPPDGYLLNGEVYAVDSGFTDPDGEIVLSFSHTFYDTPTCLIVTKLHSQLQNPLAGAKISLYRALETENPDQEEWIPVASWTSEDISKFLWALVPGRYRLVEDQAPHGYYLADPVEFTIAENTPLTLITLENTPIPPQEPRLPSSPGAPTGDDSPLGLACLGLLGSIIVMVPLIGWSPLKKRH